MSQTPLMQQYTAVKHAHPDALVLFQVGDFYELFFDDANTAATILGIALTKRGKQNGVPIPLCGVPVHTIDHYIAKLVRAGFHVAVCDQLEEAVPGKVVERGVTRVFTPGTLTDTKLLDARSASYVLSLFPAQTHWGLVFAEVLTGHIHATRILADERVLEAHLNRFFPDEIIVPEHTGSIVSFLKQRGYVTTVSTADDATDVRVWMSRHFGSGVEQQVLALPEVVTALSRLYAYLKKNMIATEQFKQLTLYRADDFLELDASTSKHLELVKNSSDGTTAHTVFSVLDRAQTAMGSRMIKKWLAHPLKNIEFIEQRFDIVSAFKNDISLRTAYIDLLKQIGDIERVVGRIALKKAHVHDYRFLKDAVGVLEQLKSLSVPEVIRSLRDQIVSCAQLADLLSRALHTDTTRDWIIAVGFDAQLDRLRETVEQSTHRVAVYERDEQQRTGIQSLKVGYTSVHGYYIEITKANYHLVPADYVRHQTLVGRERFVTPYLKQLYADMVHANHAITTYEQELFDTVKEVVFECISPLRVAAHVVAQLDALIAFALVAHEQGYVRPTFNTNRDIIIRQGKHPVVYQRLLHAFIANDTHLTDEQSTMVITGPNMGGKSTYLRQVALICLLAQCGSFVPATECTVPILDRIFTRIGASDNVAEGKSTFLVEMEEVALICAQATRNSLVILDEVGRGTSTADGCALAHAIAEYIHIRIQARCLFATHYHEVAHLELPGLAAYHAVCVQLPQGIAFLHTIRKGQATSSFGLEVAALAGLPPEVIARARTFTAPTIPVPGVVIPRDVRFDELTGRIQSLDFDNLSPRQALEFLWKLKNELE